MTGSLSFDLAQINNNPDGQGDGQGSRVESLPAITSGTALGAGLPASGACVSGSGFTAAQASRQAMYQSLMTAEKPLLNVGLNALDSAANLPVEIHMKQVGSVFVLFCVLFCVFCCGNVLCFVLFVFCFVVLYTCM